MSVEQFKILDLEHEITAANANQLPNKQISLDSVTRRNLKFKTSLTTQQNLLNGNMSLYRASRFINLKKSKKKNEDGTTTGGHNGQDVGHAIQEHKQTIETMLRISQDFSLPTTVEYDDLRRKHEEYFSPLPASLAEAQNDLVQIEQEDVNRRAEAEGVSQAATQDSEEIKLDKSLLSSCAILDLIEEQLHDLKNVLQKQKKKLRKNSSEIGAIDSYIVSIDAQLNVVQEERKRLASAVLEQFNAVIEGKIPLIFTAMSRTQSPDARKGIKDTEFLGFLKSVENYWDHLTPSTVRELKDLPLYSAGKEDQSFEVTKNPKERAVKRFGVAGLVPKKVRRIEFLNRGHNFRARWFVNTDSSTIHMKIDVGMSKIAKKTKRVADDIDSTLGWIENTKMLDQEFRNAGRQIYEGRKLFSGRLSRFFNQTSLKFLSIIEGNFKSLKKEVASHQITLAQEIAEAYKGKAEFRDKFGTDRTVYNFLLSTLGKLDGVAVRGVEITLLKKNLKDVMREMDETASQIASPVASGSQSRDSGSNNEQDDDASALRKMQEAMLKPFEGGLPPKRDVLKLISYCEQQKLFDTADGRESAFAKKVVSIYQYWINQNNFYDILLDDAAVKFASDKVPAINTAKNGLAMFLEWGACKRIVDSSQNEKSVTRHFLSRYLKSYSEICSHVGKQNIPRLQCLENPRSGELKQLFVDQTNQSIASLKDHELSVWLKKSLRRHEEILLILAEDVDPKLFEEIKKMIECRRVNNVSDLSRLANKLASDLESVSEQVSPTIVAVQRSAPTSPSKVKPASSVESREITELRERVERAELIAKRMKTEAEKANSENSILRDRAKLAEKDAFDAKEKLAKTLKIFKEKFYDSADDGSRQQRDSRFTGK